MHLKEVVINGFKSFADKTHISLGKGVTCVVGPNGCGKSNIVDAIRWVLGEQSAKALRGGKMQDVIFEGTDKRKPVTMCEVSLVFTDCEEELGTAFNEVEITRRVTRDGSSDYFINGKRSRLRDIQMLFMDTGIGRASYSFMMQGQIDQILSSNPAERRIIFEEAAGITRYKSQRREALSKLGLVDQNLSRVTDVIEEVTRQIGSLKRQASKALRFKRLKHRFTHLDLAYNGFLYSQRQGAIKELEEKVAAARIRVSEKTAGLSERESILEGNKAKRAESYARMQAAQQAVFDLRSAKEAAENQAEFGLVRSKDLQRRMAEIREEIVALQEQKDSLVGKAQLDAEHRLQAESAVSSSDEVFQQRNSEVNQIQAQLGQLEVQLQARRRDLLVVEGSITRTRQQCTSFEVDLKTYQVKHAGLSDTLYQLREEQMVLENRLDQVLTTRARREEERADAEDEVTRAQEESILWRNRFRELQQQIQEVDRLVASRSARLSLLEDMQARFEGFSDGARAILQGKLEGVLPAASFRALSRQIKVTAEEYTAALETLLGQAAEAIMLNDSKLTDGVIAELTQRKLGRAVLQMQVPHLPQAEVAVEMPPWLVAASSVVQATRESDVAAIESLLHGCYFCESYQEFAAFWQQHPEFHFLFVATADGQLIDRRGLVYGGSARGGKVESSFIQRESEIRRVKEELLRENERLTDLNEEAMRMQAQLDATEAAVEEKRKRVVEIGQELSSLQTQEKAARETIRQNEDSARKNDRILADLEGGRASLEERLAKGRAELDQAEKRIEEHRSAIAYMEEEIAQCRAKRDEKIDSLGEVRIDLAEKKQRLELLNRGLLQIEEQRADLEQRLLRRAQELDTLSEQSEDLQASSQRESARAQQIEETLQQTMGSLNQHKAGVEEIETEIARLEEGLAGERSGLRQEEAQLNAAEVKLAQETSQARFLHEKVEVEHGLDITRIDWKAQLWKADEEFEVKVRLDDLEDESDLEARPRRERGTPNETDLEAMEHTQWDAVSAEIRQLRDRISSLGAVNLVAIEEYAELKQRFDFLKSQSDDLWKAKEELLKAIDEINETSQTLFKETFDQIRKNFQFTFLKLFGGGEADLKLIEAEDVLDSGIDIIARPPGTRLKGLSLLSGGQRTMTAVGLLFAIYMVKPSPFCVLDELDAPLDDANIERFTDMLQQFTEYSQFLVITHNKRTVAAADAIYGVTMQERGVTKLVSLRFNKDTNDTVEIQDAAS